MTAARKLQHAPTAPQVLREEIYQIGRQIDRRLGNRPGTAERGIYFWLWPPDSLNDLGVLARLHADAIEFLHDLTTTPKETP